MPALATACIHHHWVFIIEKWQVLIMKQKTRCICFSCLTHTCDSGRDCHFLRVCLKHTHTSSSNLSHDVKVLSETRPIWKFHIRPKYIYTHTHTYAFFGGFMQLLIMIVLESFFLKAELQSSELAPLARRDAILEREESSSSTHTRKITMSFSLSSVGRTELHN